MATRTKATATPPENPFDDDDDPGTSVIPGTGGALTFNDEVEESPAERIARQAREMATDQNAVVKLYRIQPGTRKLEWCEDFSPEEYESGGDSMIRNKWGAGTYHVRIYGDVHNPRTQSPMRSCLGRADITIAAPRNVEVQSQQNGELSQVLQLLAQQNARIMEAITNRPQADPAAQLRETLGLMTLMREAMGLTQAAQPQKTQISEIIDAVRELRGVAGEILPDRESEPSPLSMLPKILDVVQAGLSNRAAAPQLPVTPLPPIRVPPSIAVPQKAPPTNVQPFAPAPTPADASQDESMIELQRMRDNELASIIKLAEAGADPQEGADIIYEKLPDEMIELLASGFWFTQLSFVAPEVKPHREWITKARDLALAMFDDPATDDDSDSPAPADIPG